MLSVVIITFNEQSNIAGCIRSVEAIADEILVLDSFSTDNTPQICRELGVRFEQHTFDGHIQQKNRARLMASQPWVLSLDADERPDETLLHEIRQLKENGFAGPDGYTMNRLNFYCGKAIRTCGWYPDRKLRLWKKDAGAWTGVNPHDRFELTPPATAGHLNGDILHNTYPTHAAMLSQVKKFAAIGAKQYRQKPVFWLLVKMLFSAPFKFLRSYFLKLGITDGKAGLLISYHQMREVFLKYYGALRLKFIPDGP